MSNKNYSKRMKNLDGFHANIPFLMPKRTEAEVSITETFDISDLQEYIRKRRENGDNIKLFHAICTAFIRTIYLRPLMNCYISGKRYWMRDEISLSFVAKQQFNDTAEETLMFLTAKPEMNLDDISMIIHGDVEKARKEGSNDLGGVLDTLAKLPRFMLNIVWGFARFLEYFNIMPASLREGDPNYSTALISNLGSIGCGSVYHHLSNYGSCSMIVTIGTAKTLLDENGEKKDVVDMTFTIDERIADGFYFAKSLKITKYLLAHPELLMQPINSPVDISL